MKKLLPLLIFILPTLVWGQIDTEFWFAAPDVTEGTGSEARRDSTVYIVVSCMNEAAEIRINQPANPAFQPIVLNLAPNTTQAINLGLFLSLLETKPANAVLNTGVLIRATAPITAYYEIRSANNREIFSLKGRNALGTKFYTPFEDTFGNNEFFNNNPYLPPPRAGFVVVASQDSTTVSISPKVAVLGHPANETFDVMLMRGQSYYVEAIDGDVANKPIGTKIESDKPIAVTLKDDMIDYDLSTTAGADIAADQMFAYEWTGLRHIAVRGNLNGNNDRVVVLATVDGTTIHVNGNHISGTFNEGEQYVFNFDGPAAYIESSEKVYVFHATGQSDQLSGALIPPIDCTGSNQVGFVRPTIGPFFSMHITIRAGAEGEFTLNGNPNLVPASAFSPVPGTDGEYVFAKLQFSNNQIALGSANTLENSGDELFHLGLLTASSGNSANFGYFSAFSYLNIGDSREVCLGDSVVLDAGPGKTEYLWSTGETTQSITVTSAGVYYVDAFSGTQCSASDTVMISYYKPPISLGPNDTICAGTTLNLEIAGSYLFEWQDGSTGPSLAVSEEGWIWLEVTDFQGCTLRDSTYITVSERPDTPTISGENVYCEGESLLLQLSSNEDANYRFIRPDGSMAFGQTLTIESAEVENSGRYYGYIVVEGCESFSDSLDVTLHAAPQVSLPGNHEACAGDSFIIEPTVDGQNLTFEWQDGSDASTYEASSSGQYWLKVINENNCADSDTMHVTINPLPADPTVSGNEATCEGSDLQLSIDAEQGATYTWMDADGNVLSEASTLNLGGLSTAMNGTYSVQAELESCLSQQVFFQINVVENPVVMLPADTLICEGDEIIISASGDFESYTWSHGADGPVVWLPAGNYEVTAVDEAGCEASAVIDITESSPTAAFGYSPNADIRPETIIAFSDQSDPGDGTIVSRLWTFSGNGSSNNASPTYQFATSGLYTVSLTVTDEKGCSSSTSAQIKVSYDLKIPEGFSPNGDGVNDIFFVRGLEPYPGSSLQIFNRWGAMVYESSYYNNNWDGANAPDGTYFYILKLPNGEDFAGPITIAR